MTGRSRRCHASFAPPPMACRQTRVAQMHPSTFGSASSTLPTTGRPSSATTPATPRFVKDEERRSGGGRAKGGIAACGRVLKVFQLLFLQSRPKSAAEKAKELPDHLFQVDYQLTPEDLEDGPGPDEKKERPASAVSVRFRSGRGVDQRRSICPPSSAASWSLPSDRQPQWRLRRS